jgi:hypothetical protein
MEAGRHAWNSIAATTIASFVKCLQAGQNPRNNFVFDGLICGRRKRPGPEDF